MWTTERPTTPGRYWWRGEPDDNEPVVFEVINKAGTLLANGYTVDYLQGEWQLREARLYAVLTLHTLQELQEAISGEA